MHRGLTKLTLESTMREIEAYSGGEAVYRELVDTLIRALGGTLPPGSTSEEIAAWRRTVERRQQGWQGMPLIKLTRLIPDHFNEDQLREMLARIPPQ